MTALDELERCLTLADAAVTRDEHALAEHLDEHAVLRQTRGEIARERGDEVGHELRGVLAHEKEVAVILFRHLQALRKRVHAVADDKADDVVAHERLKALAPLRGCERLEKRALDAADDLQPLGVKVVVKAGKLQPRPVDVGRADRYGITRCAHGAHLLSDNAAHGGGNL